MNHLSKKCTEETPKEPTLVFPCLATSHSCDATPNVSHDRYILCEQQEFVPEICFRIELFICRCFLLSEGDKYANMLLELLLGRKVCVCVRMMNSCALLPTLFTFYCRGFMHYEYLQLSQHPLIS